MSLNKTGVSLNSIHKVTSNKVNASFERAGKNGLLVLTSEKTAGLPAGSPSVIDTTNRVVTYQTFEDFAAEWNATSDVYQAVEAAYSQGVTPSEVTIGCYDDGANILNELNAIRDCYNNFFGLITPNLKDDPRQLDVASWTASFSPQHVYSALTCDQLFLDPNDTTSIGDQIFAARFPTLVNYQDTSIAGFLDAEAAGYFSAQNFDVVNGYTLFGAQLVGTAPSPLNDTQFATLANKRGNAKVCISGSNIDHYDAGRLADGSFVDSCHKLCWLNIQLQEAQLATQLEDGPPRNSRAGYQDYIDRYEEPLALAVERGLIQDYQINAPTFDELTRSQLASREPVCISADIDDNGFIHGSCIENQFTL